MKKQRKYTGPQNRKIGAAGEVLAERVLRQRGLSMVEKIGTPVKLIPLKQDAKTLLARIGVRVKGLFHVKFGDRVSGDRRAIIRGAGTSVLIETKTVMQEKLSVKHFKSHQLPALDRHSELGGLSLIVWVHETGVYVMQHPIPGFMKGKPLSVEQAAAVDIMNIPDLVNSGNHITLRWKTDNTDDMATVEYPPPDPIDVNFAMRDILDALDLPNVAPAVLISLYSTVSEIMGPKPAERKKG